MFLEIIGTNAPIIAHVAGVFLHAGVSVRMGAQVLNDLEALPARVTHPRSAVVSVPTLYVCLHLGDDAK